MPLETEAQRQFYLGIAGIQLWYARNPQPGAAPSPDFDFEGCIVAVPLPLLPADKKRPAVEKLRSDEGLARVQGLMKDVQSQPHRPAEDRQVTESAVKAPVPDKAPVEIKPATLGTGALEGVQLSVSSDAGSLINYNLTATWAVWITDSFVLVSTLSSDSSAQLQDSLATNILRAMGQSVDATQTFMWPVFSNPVVPGNDAEGFRQLLAEFAKDCQGRSFFGFGLLSDAPQAARAVWLERAFGPLKIDFPHGLAGIATDPNRKRDLWAELKPLVSVNR